MKFCLNLFTACLNRALIPRRGKKSFNYTVWFLKKTFFFFPAQNIAPPLAHYGLLSSTPYSLKVNSSSMCSVVYVQSGWSQLGKGIQTSPLKHILDNFLLFFSPFLSAVLLCSLFMM